jgi:hypothetical protein
MPPKKKAKASHPKKRRVHHKRHHRGGEDTGVMVGDAVNQISDAVGDVVGKSRLQRAAELARQVGDVLNQTRIVSTAADMFNPNVGRALRTVGLGKRRGGSWYGDIGGKLLDVAQLVPLAAMGALGATAQGVRGLGRRGGAMGMSSAYGSRPVLV